MRIVNGVEIDTQRLTALSNMLNYCLQSIDMFKHTVINYRRLNLEMKMTFLISSSYFYKNCIKKFERKKNFVII